MDAPRKNRGTATDSLSELEHAVLGIVWKEGPCTRYTVRSRFQDSPSSHWSGSAGSIYPLVDRLERRELLRSSAQTQGRRKSRAVSVTEEGRRVLVDWLRPPISEQAVAVHFDGLRTRMFFLEVLTPKQRVRFLEDTEERLVQAVESARAYAQSFRDAGDEFGWLAARGALRVTRARLAWIREVRRELEAG